MGMEEFHILFLFHIPVDIMVIKKKNSQGSKNIFCFAKAQTHVESFNHCKRYFWGVRIQDPGVSPYISHVWDPGKQSELPEN